MKLFILSLCCLLSADTITAQTSKIDSFNLLISKAASDTERINLIVKKLDILSNINLDSAIYLGNQTLKIAQQIGFYQGELKLRQKLAANYCFKGAYAQAEENLNFLEKFIKPSKDSTEFAALYANRGMMYGMQSKYDSSIDYYEKAIGITERYDKFNRLSSYYSNIAISYQQQSNFTQALFYQQKALKKSEEAKNEVSAAYTTMNIGNTYDGMADVVRAEEHFLKAIELAKKKSLINVELYGYSNLASLYIRQQKWPQVYEFAIKAATLGASMGDQGIQAASLSKAAVALAFTNKLDEAEALGKRSIAIADSSGQPLNIYQAYSTTANVLRLKGNFTEAIPFYEKGFLAMKDSDIYTGSNGIVYTELSECYEKTGNFGKALENYKIAKKISDSVASKNNIQKATELTMNYEFDKKQQLLLAKQKAKDEVAGAKQLALAVGLILTLVLAVVAFIGFSNKQKANTLLESQKKEIERTLALLKATQSQLIQSEKMASLGELTAGIAHEIENPLNFVNNFSELNKELLVELKGERSKVKTERDEKLEDGILSDVEQNLEKVIHHGKRADSIVKAMLQHSRSSTGQKESTDINKLAEEYLRLAYLGLKGKDNNFTVTMKTETDPAIGSIPVIPQDIGRVLFNLFNNAFYAVNERKKQMIDGLPAEASAKAGYEPIVSVSTKRIGYQVEIVVQDNGGGIPVKVADKIFQPFFTTKPPGQGTGLGLSLSYDIIKAHGGEIRINNTPDEGVEFIITLPDSPRLA